jgi:hypothetical protein
MCIAFTSPVVVVKENPVRDFRKFLEPELST